MTARVLVVDDERRMAEAMVTALTRRGHECTAVGSAEEALEHLAQVGADVVVTDRRMPGLGGDALVQRIAEIDPGLPVIVVTAFGDVASAVEAMKQGAFHYLTKPFDNDQLRALVDRAWEVARLRRENSRLRRELDARVGGDLVAASDAMQSVLALVDRAAPSSSPVLLEGESGTGKELLARRLHERSNRRSGPFEAVNCRAFAPGLLESELFGHVRGAFTGADRDRAGCFERAHRGTLFLDEIGEVDQGFQAKLLRAVQEGEILRVGGNRPRTIDVRIVAATNRRLQEEIGAGRFREDLYYRLAVIPVAVPPLRDRPDDVLPLAEHFLRRRRPDLTLGTDAREALLAHRWPGNVRELENAIERAAILAREPVVRPADLLLRTPDTGSDASPKTLQAALDERTVVAIRSALAAAEGQRSEAARRLGIDRSTLFRLMRRLGL